MRAIMSLSKSRNRRAFENIARFCLRPAYGAGGQLKNGVRGETGRQAPWWHTAPHLSYAHASVQIHEINRESHPESMDGFARNDPQTFSSGELVAPQQTLSALRSIIGHFHAGRE